MHVIMVMSHYSHIGIMRKFYLVLCSVHEIKNLCPYLQITSTSYLSASLMFSLPICIQSLFTFFKLFIYIYAYKGHKFCCFAGNLSMHASTKIKSLKLFKAIIHIMYMEHKG